MRDIEIAAGELFRTVGMDDVADDDGPDAGVLSDALTDGRLWVATVDSVPVGYALALLLEDGTAHLEQVSVDPAHGRRGLGAALVGAAVRWAVEGAQRSLTLSTFRDLAWNRPYYERLGFAVVPNEARSPALVSVQRHEQELGLDVYRRVIMARALTHDVAED